MHLKIKQHIPFYTTLLLILVGLQMHVFCQTVANEKVFVHLNRNVLLSGSELKYTAYITNEKDTNLSTVIYFELIDCNQLSVLSWNMNTNNAWVSGIKNIPDYIPNGVYYLIAYTNKIRNYQANAVYSAPLLIQRIYEDPLDSICLKKEINLSDSSSIDGQPFKNDYLSIEIKKDSVIKLVFNPLLKLKAANISVAVTEATPFLSLSDAMLFDSFITKGNLALNQNAIELLPAEKGYHILSGKIINNTDSTPLAQKLVYLSYSDSTLHFSYFNTTENGEFCFLLDSTFNNKVMYLQLNTTDCKKDNVSWIIDNKTITNKPVTKQISNKITETEKEYVRQLQKREIIDRVYNPNILEQNSQQQGIFKNNFFQTPSYVIKPSDYVELLNFQDICDNILPSVRFKKVDHNVQIGMVIDQQVVFENVLISVNGIPCFNMNYIENLSSKDIKQIEIFNSVLMHGDLTFNGVIAIYTYKKELDERAFCMPFYTFENKFYTFNKPVLSDKKEFTPTVNPNIYWNPSLVILEKTPTTITFKKPEIGNKYIISINGLINTTIPFGYTQEIKMKQ